MYSSIRASAAPVSAPDTTQKPASNTNAVRTLAAPTDATKRWIISEITWSFTADPAAGTAIVIGWNDPSAGAVTETIYVARGGPGQLNWTTPRAYPPGSAVTITLNAGGSGISGSIYPDAWLE